MSSAVRVRRPIGVVARRGRAAEPGFPDGPPGGGWDGGGGGGGWRLLTTAPDQVVAHLIRGRLAEEAIESVLDTSNPSPGAWLKPFGDPMAPVRIFVRRGDFDRAALVLHEVDHRPPDPTAPGPRRLRLFWWLAFATTLMLALLQLLASAPCVRPPFLDALIHCF